MTKSYYIPNGTATIEIVIRRSRFISNAIFTPSIKDAKNFIGEIKLKYPAASHYVYAFAIGHGASVTHGMSDAGEPSNTAGKPTLAVLKGSDLGDITIVTVRYFGGTKLGKGGLIKAYTESAQEVLEELPCIEKVEKIDVYLDVPYHFYEIAKYLIESHEGEILQTDFAISVVMTIQFTQEKLNLFKHVLAEKSAGQFQVNYRN